MSHSQDFNRHLLRTLLLEGENSEKMLNAVKKYSTGKKSEEDHAELANTLKKEVTKAASSLLEDDQIGAFIEEVSQQLG